MRKEDVSKRKKHMELPCDASECVRRWIDAVAVETKHHRLLSQAEAVVEGNRLIRANRVNRLNGLVIIASPDHLLHEKEGGFSCSFHPQSECPVKRSTAKQHICRKRSRQLKVE